MRVFSFVVLLCFWFWLQRNVPTMKPIVCVCMCVGGYFRPGDGSFSSPGWGSNPRQVTLIRQVIRLRLMWPLDGQLQEASVGDKLYTVAKTGPAGGIRSTWSWITFTDWIRNLQQFDWIASQPSFFLGYFMPGGGLQGTDLMMGHFSLAITLCNLYNDTVKQKSLQPAITHCNCCSFLF